MRSFVLSVTKEIKLLFRNSIALFMIAAPALLSLVVVSVLSDSAAASASFAVHASVPAETVARLEKVAEIESFLSFEKLEERVRAADSVCGLYMSDGVPVLLAEGNEGEGFIQSMRALAEAALGGDSFVVLTEAVESENNFVINLAYASLFLLSLFISGTAFGLSGVSERETGVIKALFASPAGLFGYSAAKIFPAILFSLLNTVVCAAVTGKLAQLPALLEVAAAGVFVCGLLIFILTSLADNQVAAIGVLKLVMPLFLMAGMSSAFVAKSWQFFYYPFPIYWQYRALSAALLGEPLGLSVPLLLLTGLAWFLLSLLLFSKKTKLYV